jgi:hypothetical protein
VDCRANWVGGWMDGYVVVCALKSSCVSEGREWNPGPSKYDTGVLRPVGSIFVIYNVKDLTCIGVRTVMTREPVVKPGLTSHRSYCTRAK